MAELLQLCIPAISGMSFASLPYELRSHIWTLAAQPRRITNVRTQRTRAKLSKSQRKKWKDVLYETTSTPPPVLMHVCRESRRHAPYERAFTAGAEPRWTWINFELDILCVTDIFGLRQIVSHRHQVQRLHIRTDDDRDWYESATIYNGLDVLKEFVDLKEIHVVMTGAPNWCWAHVFTDWGFGGCKNVTFLDKSGLVLTGPQLRLACDWRWHFSFDSDGNPPEADMLSEYTEDAHSDSWHLSMAQMYEID